MKKFTLLMSILLLNPMYATSVKASEGDELWNKSFGGSNYENLLSAEETRDGGFIGVGYSLSKDGDIQKNMGYDDFLIAKFNNKGEKIWLLTYGGTNTDILYDVKETSDGGFVTVGFSSSNNGDIPGNIRNQDAILAKFDSNGNKEWVKNFGGIGSDYFSSVIELPNGDFMAVGYTYSRTGVDVAATKGGLDGVIARFDKDGNKLWMKNYGGPGNDEISEILYTKDGNVVIYANSNSVSGDLIGNKGNSDIVFAKYDLDGNQIWQHNYGGTDVEFITEIKEVSNENIIATGYTRSTNGDITHSKGGYDALILKFDKDGNKEWVKTIGGSSTEIFNSVIETQNNSFVAFGYSASIDGDLNETNNVLGQNLEPNILMVKINPSGETESIKTIGGTKFETVTYAQLDDNNDYTLLGVTNSPEYNIKGLNDIFITKIEGDHTPPSEIKNLTEEHNYSTIDLQWENPSDLDFSHINIYKENTLLHTTSDTSFSDINLEEGTEYLYKITTVDKLGNESEGVEISIKTDDITPPDIPINIEGVGKDGTIFVSWEHNIENDLAGYHLYLNGSKHNIEMITDNKYQLTGLNVGETFKISVSAVDNNNNESAKSEEIDVLIVDTIAPNQPSISFISLIDGKITVKFENDLEEDFWGYNLYLNGQKVNLELIKDFVFNFGLPPGANKIVATTLDQFMNESVFSIPLIVEIEDSQEENDNTDQTPENNKEEENAPKPEDNKDINENPKVEPTIPNKTPTIPNKEPNAPSNTPLPTFPQNDNTSTPSETPSSELNKNTTNNGNTYKNPVKDSIENKPQNKPQNKPPIPEKEKEVKRNIEDNKVPVAPISKNTEDKELLQKKEPKPNTTNNDKIEEDRSNTSEPQNSPNKNYDKIWLWISIVMATISVSLLSLLAFLFKRI